MFPPATAWVVNPPTANRSCMHSKRTAMHLYIRYGRRGQKSKHPSPDRPRRALTVILIYALPQPTLWTTLRAGGN